MDPMLPRERHRDGIAAAIIAFDGRRDFRPRNVNIFIHGVK
jgi:hypothetical protein